MYVGNRNRGYSEGLPSGESGTMRGTMSAEKQMQSHAVEEIRCEKINACPQAAGRVKMKQ